MNNQYQVFCEGMQAFDEGRSYKANPYEALTPEYDDWQLGYAEAYAAAMPTIEDEDNE